MKKLIITTVGSAYQIEEAERNIREFLNDCPIHLEFKIATEEVDYEQREQYVVRHENMDWAYDSLEDALALAIKEVSGGVPAEDCVIKRCEVSYLDGEYAGIHSVISTVIRMEKVMKGA